LKFGLNHPIFPKKVQKDKIKTFVEKLIYSLKRNTDIEFDDEARDKLKFLVKKFTDDATRVSSERYN